MSVKREDKKKRKQSRDDEDPSVRVEGLYEGTLFRREGAIVTAIRRRQRQTALHIDPE